MKKIIFAYLFIFSTASVLAQSGETISEAVDVDGTDVSVDLLDLTTTTNSGLTPMCSTSPDIFFKHTVSVGDNSVTIGMVSAGTILAANFEYQIFVAPGGNLGSLAELTCDSYVVPILASGSFEFVIENVVPGDVYYLRVFEPQGLGGNLSNLLSATTITLISYFDPTLSVNELENDFLRIIVGENAINLYNGDFKSYAIYGLDGKHISSESYNSDIESINIDFLNKGLYVLVLEDAEEHRKPYKFIRY